MKILAIDPGPVQSAWVRWDGCTIHGKGKEPNEQLIDWLRRYTAPNLLAIEQIKSYGMAVSDTVFDTVFWSGRFAEAWSPRKHIRVPRMDVKMHLCGSSRAKDGNIIQALCDRFARGEPNRGKGTKSKPGFFYGFSADIWQAFALAVVVFDRETNAAA